MPPIISPMPKVRLRQRQRTPDRSKDAPVQVDEPIRVTPALEDILPAYVAPGSVTSLVSRGGGRNQQATEADSRKTVKPDFGGKRASFLPGHDPRRNLKGRPPKGKAAADRIRKWGQYSLHDLMWMRTIPWLPAEDLVVISRFLGAAEVNSFGGGDSKNAAMLWDRTDGKPATTANINADVNASFTFGDLLQSALTAPDEDEETDD